MAASKNNQNTMTLNVPSRDSRRHSANLQQFLPEPNQKTTTTGHLTEAEIEQLKVRLLAKRKEVLETLTGIEHEVSAVNTNRAGPMDVADMAFATYTTEQDYGVLESERHLLDDIDKSLHWIEEGTYGLCEECMEQIPKRRLWAIPWANCCIACASGMQNSKQAADEKERQRWAREHAYRLKNLWEQWQKPLGIDSQEYYNYAAKDLLDYYDDPLRRSLIESLC